MQYVWDYNPLSIDIIDIYGCYFSPEIMELNEMVVLPCDMWCHVLVWSVYAV